MGCTSQSERYNQIAAMVKEKTGRAMQTKDRECVNKKTEKEHLERADFILAKQKQETDNAKSEHEKLQIGNEEKQRRSVELDSEVFRQIGISIVGFPRLMQ